MADGTVTILVDVDGKEVKVLNSDLEKITGSGKKAGTSIKNMAVSMGLVKVASAAFNVLKNSLDGAISRFDTMQKFPKVMSALGFSVEDSEKSISKLSDGIDGLPTKLDDVVSSTQRMTSVTGDLDKSTDTVLALNNAFLASGASTEDASRGMDQYIQMMSTGTVDLESWKTLQETMPIGLQKTAEAMGFVGKTAQRDLYGALKDGTVTFDQFQDKMIELGTGTGELASLAQENSKGIATSFGNLKNAVVKNLANIITKFDEITQALTGKTIAENIDGLKVLINNSMSAITDSLDKVVPFIQNMISAFEDTGAIDFFKEVIDSVKGTIENVVGVVVERIPAIQETIENVFSTIEPIISGVIDGAKQTLEQFSEVFSSVLPVAIDIFLGILNGLLDFLAPAIDAFMDFADVLRENVGDFITNELVPAIENFGTMLEENKGIVDALTGVVVAAGGALLAFKGYLAITSIISGVSKAIGILTKGFTILSNVGIGGVIKMIAGFMSPVGWVITIVGAVVALIVYLWNTNEGFRNAVISIWEAIKGAFVSAWEAIKEAWQGAKEWFSAIWEGIKEGVVIAVEGIQNAWGAIKEFFTNLWTSITEVASAAWSAFTEAITAIITPFIDGFMNIWNGMSEGLSMIWEGIKMIAQGAWELLKNIILTPVLMIVDLVTGDFGSMGSHLSQIWENIKSAASMIWEGIKTYFSGVVTAIVGAVKAMFENLKGNLSVIWEGIKSIASSVWNALKSAVISIIDGLVSGAKSAWNSLKDFLSNLINGIKSTMVNTWNSIKSSVINTIDGLVNGAKRAWENLKTSVTDTVNNVKNIFNKLKEINLFDIGKNIIQGLINGIGSMVGAVKDKITGLAGSIKDKITGALGIHSPSRWMRDYVGKFIPQGIAVGIDADADEAYKSMHNLTKGLTKNIAPEMALGTNKIGEISGATRIINNSKSYQNTSISSNGTDSNKIISTIERLITVVSSQSAEAKIYLDTGILLGEVNQGLGNISKLGERGIK